MTTESRVSRYHGVTWHRHKRKWCAQLHQSDHRCWLGEYKDDAEAAKVYDVAAQIVWGPEATMNFRDSRPRTLTRGDVARKLYKRGMITMQQVAEAVRRGETG